MTFDVEIMLRQNERVFTERVTCDRGPAEWTEADARSALTDILRAIERVQRRGDEEARDVSLRGVSWIVSPYQEGVVIALEIHSASAVAGPFKADQESLTRLLARVVQGSEGSPVVH
jgi:hypothetical protein